MKITVRKKEKEFIPLLFYVIFYTLARSFCSTELGLVSHLAFFAIVCFFIFEYIYTYREQKVKICRNAFWISYILYMLYVLINLLFAPSASIYAIFEYSFYMTFIFAIFYVMNNIAFEKVLLLYEIVGVIIAVEAVWEFFSGNILYRTDSEVQNLRRAYGLIGSPLTLGMALAFITLIAVYRGMISDKKHYFVALISIAGLFCTQSRGPLVAGVLGFAVMIFVHYSSKSRNSKLSALKGILIVLLALILMLIGIRWLSAYVGIANTIYQRIQSILVWNSTESANFQRMSKWQDAFKIFKMHPIFGNGVSSTGSRAATGIVLESGVLKKLVETGLIGFLLYYFMMLSTALKNVRQAMKGRIKYGPLAAGVMTAFFVENFILQIVESAGAFMIFMWFFTYLIAANWEASSQKRKVGETVEIDGVETGKMAAGLENA